VRSSRYYSPVFPYVPVRDRGIFGGIILWGSRGGSGGVGVSARGLVAKVRARRDLGSVLELGPHRRDLCRRRGGDHPDIHRGRGVTNDDGRGTATGG
jgi:hypothetical protein